MDWQQLRPKRSSLSGLSQQGSYTLYPISPRQNQSRFAYPNYPDEQTVQDNGSTRASYYSSQHPLFCADWVSTDPTNDWVVLSSFREGYLNRVQVVHGLLYNNKDDPEDPGIVSPTVLDTSSSSEELRAKDLPSCAGGAFDWTNVAETAVEYPLTNVQWDP